MRAISEADLAWGDGAAHLVRRPRRASTCLVEDLGGPPPLERTPRVAALAGASIELGGAARPHVRRGADRRRVSDGSWTAHAGIPTLDGLGPVGGLDHGPDEYVETATLASRCGSRRRARRRDRRRLAPRRRLAQPRRAARRTSTGRSSSSRSTLGERREQPPPDRRDGDGHRATDDDRRDGAEQRAAQRPTRRHRARSRR